MGLVVQRTKARSQRFQAMQARFAGLMQQLPSASEVPALLEDIARLGAANGVLVDAIVVLDEQPRPLYIEQPLRLGVTGAYHDLAMFLSALGGLPRIAIVEDGMIDRVSTHAEPLAVKVAERI